MRSAILVTLVALASPIRADEVGGSDAVPHAHPYQVGLKITPLGWREQFCSGALISKEWVVVAGHCLHEVRQMIAVLGAHNLKERESTVRTLPVLEHIVHPDYDGYYKTDDIGLVKLADGLVFDENIEPISLPPVSRKDLDFASWPVVLTGWGKGIYSGDYLVPTLQAIHTKVTDDSVCKKLFTRNYNPKTNICIPEYQGSPHNIGKSGDPMVIEENGKQYLLGIGSHNSVPANKYPTIFTRIIPYLEWIKEVTGITPP